VQPYRLPPASLHLLTASGHIFLDNNPDKSKLYESNAFRALLSAPFYFCGMVLQCNESYFGNTAEVAGV